MTTKGRRELKFIIVEGLAAGASRAARLRRLDEKAEILVVERGPSVSYANSGLPYHVGGIQKELRLLVASEELFLEHFAIDVRTNCERVSILPVLQAGFKTRNISDGRLSHAVFSLAELTY